MICLDCFDFAPRAAAAEDFADGVDMTCRDALGGFGVEAVVVVDDEEKSFVGATALCGVLCCSVSFKEFGEQL